MKKEENIGWKLVKWILIPIDILALVLFPIYYAVRLVNEDYEHKFRIWWFTIRESWISGLKYIWTIFTFSGSDERYKEINKNYLEKIGKECDKIIEKYGEL